MYPAKQLIFYQTLHILTTTFCCRYNIDYKIRLVLTVTIKYVHNQSSNMLCPAKQLIFITNFSSHPPTFCGQNNKDYN